MKTRAFAQVFKNYRTFSRKLIKQIFHLTNTYKIIIAIFIAIFIAIVSIKSLRSRTNISCLPEFAKGHDTPPGEAHQGYNITARMVIFNLLVNFL